MMPATRVERPAAAEHEDETKLREQAGQADRPPAGRGGSQLPAWLRQRLEGGYGTELSDVRVHNDPDAARYAQAHDADAVTVGADMYFAPKQYAPGDASGRKLIAHEVAHVVQQRLPGPGAAESSREREADFAAAAVSTGGSARLRKVAPYYSPQRQPRRPTTPDPLPTVSLGTLLSIALDQLAALDPYTPGLGLLENELRRLQALPLGPDAEQVYGRAQRLMEVLTVATPTIMSLVVLRRPESFLPSVARAITSEATRISAMYGAAVLAAFAAREPDPPLIEAAERAMAGFPEFITSQYLGRSGIESLINAVYAQWQLVISLRGTTNRALISRRLDTLLGAGRLRVRDDLLRALQLARDAHRRHDPDAFERVTNLKDDTQMVLAAVASLAQYEQFSAWAFILDDHPVLDFYDSRLPDAQRWARRFDQVVSVFEQYDANASPTARQAVVAAGIQAMQTAMADPDLDRSRTRIEDRLNTIAIVQKVTTVALITAAAALTGGAAAAALEPALLVGTGSTIIATGGAFVAEVLAFTAVSRAGQTVAFGGSTDSWSHDLFWNALTLGAVKTVGSVFAQSIRTARGARLIALRVGQVASTGLVLHAVGEVQALVSSGHVMGSEERYRAVIQNVLMLAGFEMGRFLMDPIQGRIGGAISRRFTEMFRDRLGALDGQREGLRTQLEQLHRATATPDAVDALISRIDTMMREEMALIDLAGRRGIFTPDQLAEVLRPYRDAITRLSLRFAQLGIAPPAEGTAATFQPISRGVVSFGEAGRAVIEALYAANGARLTSMPEGVLRGTSPSGEVTYFVPEGTTTQRLPDYQAAVAGHDEAAVAAHDDAVAASGLRLLADPAAGYNAVNVSSILAAVPRGTMVDFLRAMADPRFQRTRSVDFVTFLARHPTALALAVRASPRMVRAINSRAGPAGWSGIVDRVDALLDETPEDAGRATLVAQIESARDLRGIEDALGTPRPPRPPRPPRAFTGARRADPAWAGYVAEARQFAIDHNEVLTDAQIDLRASMAQLLADASFQRFRYASREARIQALDAYDDMGRRSGSLQVWTNRGRGDLNEWLFNPDRAQARHYFLNGVDVGRSVSGVTIPDYSLPTTGVHSNGSPVVEWVDIKSDIIGRGNQQGDGGPYQDGIDAARRYLRHGRLDLPNLPPGDRLSIDFVRDPGPVTRLAMQAILLGSGSPYSRVRFGGRWYDSATH